VLSSARPEGKSWRIAGSISAFAVALSEGTMKLKSSGRKGHAARARRQLSGSHVSRRDFPVVAIGASAGGIEAFSELLRCLPTNTGMAFVLILHLDPKHHSILPELLAKETLMPVVQVRDGVQVLPDHVYVIPPNTSMTISDRALRLGPRENSPNARMPIDQFLRSLAEDCGDQSIGVILSGTGSDGALGITEIQAQGGVTFAQDEASAKYNGMPKSAAATGCVDYVLPGKMIARELQRIARHPHVAPAYQSPAQGEEKAHLLTADKAGLSAIFQLLHRAKGVDFTHYRQTTILRRIQRRMIVNKIDKLEDYVRFIYANPDEIKSLYQDLLITVTSFFRNPRVFDVLKLKIFPRLLKNRPPDTPVRVWTPGCATGEETYSLAIILLEFLADKSPHTQAQLFGTDVNDASIARARSGLYPDNIQGDVSAERLRRFFLKSDGGYRVSKSVRDICIFAQHNISSDPPFSQMDLICCRNVLIYLEPALQSKAISMFHYALRPWGYLVLGTSEGVEAATGLFAIEDRTYKIFSKKTAARQTTTFSLSRQNDRGEYGRTRLPTRRVEAGWNNMELQREFDRRLVTQFAPATVFVNEDMEIVHTRGNVAVIWSWRPDEPA
jgi:two-component system CheB/CheR fusion protein